MQVIYYRLWPDKSGITGSWDTDTMNIPDDTPVEQVENVVRQRVENIEWTGGESPLVCGLLSIEGMPGPEPTVEVQVFDIHWQLDLTQDDSLELPGEFLLRVPRGAFDEAISSPDDFAGFVHHWLHQTFNYEPMAFDYAV